MLIALCMGLAFLVNCENLDDVDPQIIYGEDNWPIGDWLPELGNEIAPAIDVDELSQRLRKSVHQLKSNNKIELIFLIDASSSIGEENFKSELKFVQKLVADFKVGPSDARVAVIAFASVAKTHINHLEQAMHEKCSFLHNELPSLQYTGGNTNTIQALHEARRIFESGREGAEKALFLVTDGFSNKGNPIPMAEELKQGGITIFTFGIQTGNVREVRQMSSIPSENYSFILESFSEFEALARRALHEDLKSGSYMPLNDTKLCDGLCSSPVETGCCNGHSKCSCGTLTGHFACLCPPGFYGSGLIGEECLPCPKGTYHDGSIPGDILVCTACPDRNHVTKVPAVSEDDCFCKEGYKSVNGSCEVATCPVPEVPTNGYFVKKNCSNVVNAACGIRCSTGYKLRGSSVRVCQLNGTWSGTPPKCEPKSCKKPKPVRDSTVSCKNLDYGTEIVIRYDSEGNPAEIAGTETREREAFSYTVDTVCLFECVPGRTMRGSKMRTCLPILQWNGLSASCSVVSCPPLPALKDGVVKPDNCTLDGLRHHFAAECYVSCKNGFRLEGPSLRNCTGRRGTWTGKNVPNKCIDIEPPVITCPGNLTVETAEEESYALVLLPLPKGTDNSGLEPIVWSKPPFLPEYPLPLKIGTTKIEVYATDASDNGETCEFYIQVQDNEVPKIYYCESPPTFYISDLDADNLELNWTEPIFTDNSQSALSIEKTHEFGNFPLGITSVVYVATDESGNSANCTLDITVAENPCMDRPILSNVNWNCSSESNKMNCTLSCPPGQTWTTNNDITDVIFMCQYDRSGARWHPDVFSDLDSVPECSAFELPTEVVESHEIELDEKDDLCNDLERLSQAVSNEISVLIGSDEFARVSIIADCVEDEEQSKTLSLGEERNVIPLRRKRNTGKRRVKVRVSIIGKSSNETSTEEVAKHLQEVGQKLEEEYTKNTFINVGGKKVKVQNAKKVNKVKLKCKSGFALKRGLCVKCPPGTFHDSTKSSCIPCPIGEFQNLEGQSRCESCPVGYLTRRRRRKQSKDCKRICPPGTFGKIKNYQQNLALTPCTPCPVGTYQPSQGQTSCIQCGEEQTTTKKGSSLQKQCVDKKSIDYPCYKFDCKNNGTCFVYNGYPTCLCPEGYLGSFCERERNHCDSSPCYNNAECVPVDVTSFTCVCPKGYEGELCQFEVNECASDPCANGAECTDLLNGYKCDCLPGYSGVNCEEDINECEIYGNPCRNNGTCNDLVNNYSCTCVGEFTGKHCEEIQQCEAGEYVDENCNFKMVKPVEEDGPCQGVTCPTNMECTVAAGNRNLPLCTCRKGFYGRSCSEEINFNVILTFPRRSVTEYIAVTFPPEDVHEVSVCLWMQTADNFNYGTLFSYAMRDDDNTFTITDYNGFVLYVRNERVVTDVIANDGNWHFICVMWESREGMWYMYLDGKIKGSGTGLCKNRPIPGGGRFIIGQEQDRLGGGFNEVESLVGRITHFDVWKRVLQRSEIEDMNDNCKYFTGDLIRWTLFLENIHGNIEISKSSFCTNCNVRDLRLYKGQVSVKTVGDATFGVYKCDRGYRIRFDDGDEESTANEVNIWYRKCLKHGNWEPLTPRCTRINCGFPGYFPQGIVTGNSYLFSDTIEYQCNIGYSLVGNATRMCLEDGSWSGEQPTCKGNLGFCEEILAPLHGSMFIYFGGRRKLRSSAIGDRAEFVCNEGYRLRGADTLICSEEGLWDQQVPTCEEITCTFPNKIRMYVINSTTVEGFAVGEALSVRCNDLEDSKLITCQENGSWSYMESLCGKKCEGEPEYPEHGLLLGDPLKLVYEPGDRVKTKCRYGYKLYGDDFFVCSGNGTWYQENHTICRPVECAKPIPPPNAYISSILNSYPFGRRIIFRCLHGYRQLGDLLTRCDGEGQWTNIFGRCVGVFCRVPELPEDVSITEVFYSYGDKMVFECKNGKRRATNNVFCQADGTWSEMPRCV